MSVPSLMKLAAKRLPLATHSHVSDIDARRREMVGRFRRSSRHTLLKRQDAVNYIRDRIQACIDQRLPCPPHVLAMKELLDGQTIYFKHTIRVPMSYADVMNVAPAPPPNWGTDSKYRRLVEEIDFNLRGADDVEYRLFWHTGTVYSEAKIVEHESISVEEAYAFLRELYHRVGPKSEMAKLRIV